MTEKEYRRQYYLQNKDKELLYGKLYKQRNRKRLLVSGRKYYSEHKLEESKRHKKYRERNRCKLIEYDKIYRSVNKASLREKDRVYRNEKYRTDLKYKLRVKLRTRLNRAMCSVKKNGSAVRDLGCSIESFKTYIESKFQSGMTWDNYGRGGWHLDHIIPLAKFDLSNRDQFLIASNYTNYQPLWESDNVRKLDFSLLDFRDGIF